MRQPLTTSRFRQMRSSTCAANRALAHTLLELPLDGSNAEGEEGCLEHLLQEAWLAEAPKFEKCLFASPTAPARFLTFTCSHMVHVPPSLSWSCHL